MRLLSYDFMQRALLAGALIGLAAPSIGIFIVQRRLALMGDGMGHLAFTGVAAGLMWGLAPVFTAVVFAAAGAVAIELLRERNRTSGDVALALIFYGGIAGAVLLLSLSRTSTLNVNSYLFGSVLTVNAGDLWLVAGVAVAVLAVVGLLRNRLFAIAYDEEVARVTGLRVSALSMVSAVTAAVSIAMASKVVGVLLVSSMLVLPVATVQQLTRSFRATFAAALALGVAVSVFGVGLSFYLDVMPAATIVLTGIAAFLAVAVWTRLSARRRSTEELGVHALPGSDGDAPVARASTQADEPLR